MIFQGLPDFFLSPRAGRSSDLRCDYSRSGMYLSEHLQLMLLTHLMR